MVPVSYTGHEVWSLFFICLFIFRLRFRNWYSNKYSFELFLLKISSTIKNWILSQKSLVYLPPFLPFFLLSFFPSFLCFFLLHIWKHHRIKNSFWHFESSASYWFHLISAGNYQHFNFSGSLLKPLNIICLKPLIWKNRKGKEKWVDF